jgi:hypothetical protein
VAIVEIQPDREREQGNGIDDVDDVAAVLADVAEDDLVGFVIGLGPDEFIVQRCNTRGWGIGERLVRRSSNSEGGSLTHRSVAVLC